MTIKLNESEVIELYAAIAARLEQVDKIHSTCKELGVKGADEAYDKVNVLLYGILNKLK